MVSPKFLNDQTLKRFLSPAHLVVERSINTESKDIMTVLTLPKSSRIFVVVCLTLQAVTLYQVASRQARSLWVLPIAFFAGGFVTDLISGLFHFSFDYIWPPRTPIMGPISVEFREHHDEPTLDPSAFISNVTRGAYGALPIALITLVADRMFADTFAAFLLLCTLSATTLWMLGFHQIHSYTHMGLELLPEEFNLAVAEISKLPTKRQQRREFAKLFDSVGIPPTVRMLQRCHLFLRPEVHWRHHISFESDFSSVNGWSDPLMNLIYEPIARRKKARQLSGVTSQVRS